MKAKRVNKFKKHGNPEVISSRSEFGGIEGIRFVEEPSGFKNIENLTPKFAMTPPPKKINMNQPLNTLLIRSQTFYLCDVRTSLHTVIQCSLKTMRILRFSWTKLTFYFADKVFFQDIPE